MKILIISTSNDEMGSSGKKTGLWLEEFAAPYYVFKDAGVEIKLVSPKGGQPPLDPNGDAPAAQTEATRRFKADPAALAELAHTAKLSDVAIADYDAVFYPGGHGLLWDLADNPASIAVIEAMAAAEKPIAVVCHSPAVLHHVKAPDGTLLVKNKHVTGFSNSEEAAVGLTTVVPFLLEDMLGANGGIYSKGEDWKPHVVIDGRLISGQNPASSEQVAKALLKILKETPNK